MSAGDSVWVVDADSAVDQGLTAGPMLRLAASPDGRFVAAFTQVRHIIHDLTGTGAQRTRLAPQIKSATPPLQLCVTGMCVTERW